ncbi:type I polyketide synthase [Roseivirga sp. BDSF3-8]|uniref:type I polyketide synthase n=1 Tax=Roseivirga sp. BDSF3-8 TaxID=3241598 RepID=UPI00353196A5
MEKTDNKAIIKKALIEIRKLKAELQGYRQAEQEAVAIVGMGCRFPGGIDSPEAFWQFLSEGKDGVNLVPGERWSSERYFDPSPAAGKIYTDQGGFVDSIDRFDPVFFGISPREATYIDPQHRMLLETAWQALENAGIPVDREHDPHRTGVFVGLTTSDYLSDILERHGSEKINAFYGVGNAHNAASGRISHTFGFAGPSITVDTACSSSLTSVHLAAQALLNGDCGLALAGGVNALINPTNSIVTAQASMLSPEGRCKTFDDAADGYIRSEGCGVVVLKRLSDAQRDGNTVLAVIKGSQVNHNATSSSITVPNMKAQAALISDVLTKSGVKAEEVGYIECHGTGTNLGDPIELRALQAVFGNSHSTAEPLYIGAVKSNIGHAESAAGVAGLIKTVMALQKGRIPGNLHFSTPNKNIDWEGLPFRVVTAETEWNARTDRRYAGVSSFGVSGTNAHILLAEATEVHTDAPVVPGYVFALSAKTPEALQQLKQQYADYLTAHPHTSLHDLCLSTTKGRSQFAYRSAARVNSLEEVRHFLQQESPSNEKKDQSLSLHLTGSQAEVSKTAGNLFSRSKAFREIVKAMEPPVKARFARSFTEKIQDNQAWQPVDTFCATLALVRYYRQIGISPASLQAEGFHLLAAACFAGVFSLEEALDFLESDGTTAPLLRKPSLPVRKGAEARLLTDELMSVSFWKKVISEEVTEAVNSSPAHGLTFSLTGEDIYTRLAELYESGFTINWQTIYQEPHRQLALPNYPFARERYWLDGRTVSVNAEETPIHPYCDAVLPYAKSQGTTLIKNRLNADQIQDHSIQGKVTVPGAAYVELLLAAARTEHAEGPVQLKNISFSDTYTVPKDQDAGLQSVCEQKDGATQVSIYYPGPRSYKLCASGQIDKLSEITTTGFDSTRLQLSGKRYEGTALYEKLAGFGYHYGPLYQGIKSFTCGSDEVSGSIEAPESLLPEYDRYAFHPAMLDACLQLAGASLLQQADSETFVPVFIGNLQLMRSVPPRLKVHAELRRNGQNSTLSAIYHIYSEENEPLALIDNVIFRKLEQKTPAADRSKLYRRGWEVLPGKAFGSKKNTETALLINAGNPADSPLRQALENEGLEYLEAVHSTYNAAFGESIYPVNLLDESVCHEFIASAGNIDQVMLDLSTLDTTGAEGAQQATTMLLTLTKCLLKNSGKHLPALSLVVHTGENHPGTSGLYGLTAVLNQEEPRLKAQVIGIDRNEPNYLNLQKALCYETEEERLLLADDVIYGQRLQATKAPEENLQSNYKLKIDEPGAFSDLYLQSFNPAKPGPDEVAMRVVASGVNFKEVLYALGALPMPKEEDNTFEFGFECAGIVTAVGDNVKDIKAGDEVIGAIAPGSIGSHTIVHKDFVFQKPETLSFEEAATLPIVFITAWYALVDLAKIDQDSRVLIHAAAGGVGLSALQVAQLAGAEIFGTASQPKHHILRTKGVEHIYNSRTLHFAEEIKADTNGKGVSVVLNSLSGDFMFKSLDLLEQGGCFLEIGKVTQDTINKIKRLRPDVRYFNFDIGEIAQVDPQLIRGVFQAVLDRMAKGELKAIPHTDWPITEAEKAFAHFAKGKNIGKVVLTHHQHPEVPLFFPYEDYLVTGGNGGLGSQLLQWMFDQGARRFVVMSRSGKPEENPVHQKLLADGARITYLSADVADERSVKAAFDTLKGEGYNLRGIFHTAGLLDDHLLLQQEAEAMAKVMAPKVKGAWLLNHYAEPFALRHFVCFSSIAALIGRPGQFAYAAANAAMDSLVAWRREQGQPATTLNWGPFAGHGMARDLDMKGSSIRKLNVAEDFSAIEIALREDHQQLAIADADWEGLSREVPYYGRTPMLDHVRTRAAAPAKKQALSTPAADDLPAIIRRTIRHVLGLSEHHNVDPSRSLFDYGLDSLMAVELKNKIEKLTGEDIGPGFLFNYSTMEAIAGYFDKSPGAPVAETEKKEEDMTAEELSKLLDEELNSL